MHLEENAGLPSGLVCCLMLLPTWPTVPSTSVHLAQLDHCECRHQVWLAFVAALPFPFRRAGSVGGSVRSQAKVARPGLLASVVVLLYSMFLTKAGVRSGRQW